MVEITPADAERIEAGVVMGRGDIGVDGFP
ncbi:MAG: hypothetical protein ACI8TL_001128 [Natronomonas sp.]|jgi:hypothetical protein